MGDCFSKEPRVSIEQKILITDQTSQVQMTILPEIQEYDENGRPRLRIKIPQDNAKHCDALN